MIGLKSVKTKTNEVILKLNSALKQLQSEGATEIAEVLVKDYINFRKESASWSSKPNFFLKIHLLTRVLKTKEPTMKSSNFSDIL